MTASKVDLEKLKSMIADGFTTAQIAKAMGCQSPAITRTCARYGLPLPRRAWAHMLPTPKPAPPAQSVEKITIRVGDRVTTNQEAFRQSIRHRDGVVMSIVDGVAKCRWDGNKGVSSISLDFIDFACEGDISAPASTNRIGELLATKGKYAALAIWAEKHRVTTARANAEWLKVRA